MKIQARSFPPRLGPYPLRSSNSELLLFVILINIHVHGLHRLRFPRTSFFGFGFLFFLRNTLDRIRLPQCGASVSSSGPNFQSMNISPTRGNLFFNECVGLPIFFPFLPFPAFLCTRFPSFSHLLCLIFDQFSRTFLTYRQPRMPG